MRKLKTLKSQTFKNPLFINLSNDKQKYFKNLLKKFVSIKIICNFTTENETKKISIL